jgi:hypothetical protein
VFCACLVCSKYACGTVSLRKDNFLSICPKLRKYQCPETSGLSTGGLLACIKTECRLMCSQMWFAEACDHHMFHPEQQVTEKKDAT